MQGDSVRFDGERVGFRVFEGLVQRQNDGLWFWSAQVLWRSGFRGSEHRIRMIGLSESASRLAHSKSWRKTTMVDLPAVIRKIGDRGFQHLTRLLGNGNCPTRAKVGVAGFRFRAR